MTHTPGPWQVFANSPGNDDLPSVTAAQPAGPGLFYVAQVNRIEDARLIAVAPELLLALEHLHSASLVMFCLFDWGIHSQRENELIQALGTARDALAKVTYALEEVK